MVEFSESLANEPLARVTPGHSAEHHACTWAARPPAPVFAPTNAVFAALGAPPANPALTAAACAVAAPRAYCWGSNSTNRISPTLPGGAGCSLTAFEVAVAEGIADIARGYNHSCLLSVSGTICCIGSNFSGKSFVSKSTGTVALWRNTGVNAKSISVGGDHTCLVFQDRDAACVGQASSGQLGTGTTTDQFAPTVRVATALKFTAISAGAFHTCGLVASSAYCWGDGSLGKLGVGNTADYSLPQLVGSGLRFASISAGSRHTCAIAEGDGALYCWGSNSSGRLGDGTTTTRLTPQRLTALDVRFTQVSAGDDHTCAVDDQNRAWCFGANSGGKLGTGSTGTFGRSTPQQVVGPSFQQVSSGTDFTCGITITSTVWCWGLGASGALGGGNTINTGVPMPVVLP